MAESEQLSGSLQESLLTLLAFNDSHARSIMGVLELKYFDRPYRDIAEKIIQFRTRYRKPPGLAHLDDLFDGLLNRGDKQERQLIEDLLRSMAGQAKGLNAEYVASRANDFIRHQTIKDGLLRASERIGQGGIDADDEVVNILTGALKTRESTLSTGIYLDDPDQALAFLDHPAEVLPWGISQLDYRQLGPTRKELLLYIAARKRGKTWAVIHLGKNALVAGFRAVHYSLEMSEAKIAQRYLQSLFGVAKRPDRNLITELDLDEFKNITELRQTHRLPRLHFGDPEINAKLRRRIKQGGTRFGNLVIKSFPSGSMTLAKLNAHLDLLDSKDRFVPDLIIVDYPDLFALDPKNLRTSTGQVYVGLRGVADERNAAVVAPTQGNRDATNAREVDETNVSEDISKVATADTVITYSQTKMERKLKLARLTVTNARNDADGFSTLITQDYATGQFCLQSAAITNSYEMALKRAGGDRSDGDNED